jgi:predicted Zn-dependent protease with MMP-like domain
MEVTGTVNLAEKFPGGLPSEQDQDAFIKDACTRMTDAFLAPLQLRTTTLTLIYSTISLPSWTAGSHQVACSIGATLGNGGWATLLNSAKGALLINGQPPDPPAGHPPGTAEPAADRADADPRPVDAFVFTVDADVFAVRTHVLAVGAQQLAVQPVQPAGQPAPAPAAAAGSGPQAPAPAPAAPPPRHRHPRRTAAAGPGRRRPAVGGSRRTGGARRTAGCLVPVSMSTQRFDELLGDALDLIPPELAAAIDNVVVLVEDRDPEDPELLGLYQGIALTERDSSYAGALPDTITIYRDSLLEICDTEDDVVTEVAITVIHEIAHHFGIDDDRLHELGWG